MRFRMEYVTVTGGVSRAGDVVWRKIRVVARCDILEMHRQPEDRPLLHDVEDETIVVVVVDTEGTIAR